MTPQMKKGIITFEILLLVASPIVAIVGAYYTNILNTTGAVNAMEKELRTELSSNKNDTIINTTNIKNIEAKLEKIDTKLDRLIELQK